MYYVEATPLRTSCHAQVGDLGIARVLDASSDLAHTIIGTPYYMSPEQFSGTPYNHKSDIWALGCCVYEVATLHHAFSADNISSLMYSILHGEVLPLPTHNYSSELSCLVQSMLAQCPDSRPSVHQILKMDYIKSHIRIFLAKADARKRFCCCLVSYVNTLCSKIDKYKYTRDSEEQKKEMER